MMLTGAIFLPSVGFGFVTASILAIAAVGFTLQFGITNFLNLAYGNIMTAAAFIGYIVNQAGVGVTGTLAAGAAFGAVASAALNAGLFTPFFRRGTRGFGMVVVTISVGIILQNAILAIWGPTFFSYNVSQGSQIHAVGMVFTGLQLVIIAVAVGAMVIVQLLLNRTRLGKAMRATAANPGLAEACGIATSRVVNVAWLVSGFLCGLAGVVLVLNTSAFQSTTGNDFLVVIVAAAMLGGIGRPIGAIAAAVILGLVTEVAAAYIGSSFKEVIAFGVLLVVLGLRPQGIFTSTRVTVDDTR
jgi:branched-subunit amino acid ABC-type transport system permease component